MAYTDSSVGQRSSSPDGAESERGMRELGWNTQTRQTRRGAPVGVQRFVGFSSSQAADGAYELESDRAGRVFSASGIAGFPHVWLRRPRRVEVPP